MEDLTSDFYFASSFLNKNCGEFATFTKKSYDPLVLSVHDLPGPRPLVKAAR